MSEAKPSVIQVIDTLAPGGAERVLIDLSNILYMHGHRVKVLTTLAPGPLAEQLHKGIEVESLYRKSKWNPGTMYKLVKACKHFGLVHVHSTHNLRYVFFAFKIFFLRKPIFFHHHFGNIETDRSVHWSQRLIFPSTILIAVSRKIAAWALNDLKMPENRIYQLSNIVVKKEIPQQHIRNTDPILQLLLTANFRRAKHIEFAVVLIEILRKNRDVHLTIIGQEADTTYCEEIKQLIKEKKLEAAITIIHHCDDVQQILYQYDMALHTATSESGPLVLIEYMAQQLPFLSYQTGEVVHQVITELPELILSNFETEAWSNRIQQVEQLDKTVLKQRLLAVYEKYYSAEAYYKKCLDIYTKGLALYSK
ncbi:MAG: glycosyltransferase family 4 protein [Bacteroidota bacterium]|nr:glycosyltransferase family 4 protein [Bacteroidota bacterium]